MEDRLKLGAGMLITALLIACPSNSPQEQQGVMTVGASAPEKPLQAVSSSEYAIKGYVLRLVTSGEACIVEHRIDGTKEGKLTLDLRPPCYLLTWQRPPPTATNPVSDGQPIGAIGDPIAWRYGSATGVVVLAVIGDPVTGSLLESSLYRLRKQQGLRCASSVQGILLRPDQIRLSKKRGHAGIFCVELGLDEKDFWILAHP